VKSKLSTALAAAACTLALTVGGAKADTVNTFDVVVNYSYPTTGTFSGTLTIDVTAGTILSADISFPGSSDMTHILNSIPVSDWLLDIGVAADYQNGFMELEFTTTQAHSLIGFTGGTIFADGVVVNNGCVAGCGPAGTFTGTITPAAVPGPTVGAGLPGLIATFGGMIALARRRRRAAAALA
jgi:hypothetical protein